MYRLGKQKPDVDSAWAALPQAASEELSLAIADILQDPWGKTEPRDREKPEDVKRKLVLEHTVATLVIFDPPIRRVYILRVEPLV